MNQEAPEGGEGIQGGAEEPEPAALSEAQQRQVEEMIVTAVREAKAEIDSSINQRWTDLPASLFSDDVSTEDLVCKALSATLIVASGGVTAVAGVVALRTISKLGAAAAKNHFKNRIKEHFFSGLEAAIGRGAAYGGVVTGLGWMGYGLSCVVFGEAP